MRPASALAVLLALLGASAPALACGKLLTDSGRNARWDLTGAQVSLPNVNAGTGAVLYVIDAAGTADLSDGSEFTAVENAFQAWEDVSTATVKFERQPDASVALDSNDSTNVVVWNSGTLPPGVFAVTLTTYYAAGGNEGIIVDADIEMNEDVTWNTTTPGVAGQADVESIAAHEVGHLLGLDHSPLGQTTMFWSAPTGSIRSRSLTADDTAGVASTYPDPSYHATFGTIRGSISKAGSPLLGGWVLAVDAATQTVAVGAISLADGRFAIPGLPPGSYWIYATPAQPARLGTYFATADTAFAARAYPDLNAPGPIRSLTVFAGDEVGLSLAVENTTTPLEPDGSRAQATAMGYNQLASAAVDSIGDQDTFRFDALAGDQVLAGVLAFNAGSDLDPRIRVLDGAGLTVASNDDIVSPSGSGLTTEPGPDLDAQVSYTVPSTGAYYLRVDSTPLGATSGPYLLYLLRNDGSTEPSATASDVWVNKDAIYAGGLDHANVYVLPKDDWGRVLGPGLTVTVELVGSGGLTAVTDMGDGRYTAMVTAGPAPETVTIQARVQGTSGQVLLTDTASLTYLKEKESNSCGCAVPANGGPAHILGALLPALVLMAAVAVLRRRRRPAPGLDRCHR